MQQLITTIQQKLAGRFVRNLGWLGLAELFIRISRLAATVVLARLLTKYDYGLAAIVLTVNEFIYVFTQNGIWDKLIQADDTDLPQLCQTAYCLNWLVCGGLFLIQCAVSLPVAWFYKDLSLIWPICTMGTVYLMMPISLVQASLTQRANRLQVMALANGLQVSVDNLLTIALAFWGLGMWAIVLPKVLVGPVWVIVHYTNNSWRPAATFTLARWQDIVRFGRSVLGVKMLATLRNNLDYLMAGSFLGVEALGIYYFAFNAGLGISLSAINALDTALFPHLCSARGDPELFRQRYLSSLKTITTIVVPIVLLQSTLAPFYVPLIFGQKWVPAIPVLIFICLSAIPRPYANAAAKVLWALDKPAWDLRWNMAFTALFAIAVYIGVGWNIVGVAAGVAIVHWVAMPLYTLWVSRYTFTKEAM